MEALQDQAGQLGLSCPAAAVSVHYCTLFSAIPLAPNQAIRELTAWLQWCCKEIGKALLLSKTRVWGVRDSLRQGFPAKGEPKRQVCGGRMRSQGG